jgi:hypothetical protein
MSSLIRQKAEMFKSFLTLSSALTGTQWQRLEGTRKIRDDIRAPIEAWCDEMCVVDA